MESNDINVTLKLGRNVRFCVTDRNGKTVVIFITDQSAIEVGEAMIRGGLLSQMRPEWPEKITGPIPASELK